MGLERVDTAQMRITGVSIGLKEWELKGVFEGQGFGLEGRRDVWRYDTPLA